MKKKALLLTAISAMLLVSTYLLPEPRSEVIYWEPNKRTRDERETLNWIFEASMFADDPDKADVQMAKYASLMGYDYMGSMKYGDESGVLPHAYWAANSLYGDWWDDPRTVCLRANLNEDFPGFISWRFSEERDPETLTEEDRIIYFEGQFLNYWIDCQRDEVIDMYVDSAPDPTPSWSGARWG
jgi:hypothetical protein